MISRIHFKVRSLLTLICCLIFAIFVTSCQVLQTIFVEEKTLDLPSYQQVSHQDYIDQLNYMGNVILKKEQKHIVPIPQVHQQYFQTIFSKLVENNELIFVKDLSPRVYIIKSELPLHFSFPDGRIFFSSGLLQKYVDFEGILVSIIISELLRSYRNLYPKVDFIPFKHLSLERFITYLNIDYPNRLKINNLIYHILKRSGYNPYYQLMWLQTKSKNPIDFSIMSGSTRDVALEEYKYKSFLIKNEVKRKIKRKINNSSKEFYSFKKFIEEMKTNHG